MYKLYIYIYGIQIIILLLTNSILRKITVSRTIAVRGRIISARRADQRIFNVYCRN